MSTTTTYIDPDIARRDYPSTVEEAKAYHARTAMPAGPNAYRTLRDLLTAPRRDSEVRDA